MDTADKITYTQGSLIVPDRLALPYIAGDGIGPEVMAVALRVMTAAIEQAYGGNRAIEWFSVPAGQAAQQQGLDLLPTSTVDTLRAYRIGMKGPTMTPTGGGHRSINVAIRQILDLYINMRPIKYFKGVRSPVKRPADLDVVMFRENTEDVYAGIEFAAGSPAAMELREHLAHLGHPLSFDAGIGIKIISREKSRRLVRAAVEFALDHKRSRVTLVHKGNIQKHTEGAFRNWGFELVREEFAGVAIPSVDLAPGQAPPPGTVLVDERIADAMFQDLITNPKKFDVIATTNLNGDYLSDACAAQVGGLGLAPGANIGDGLAVFEPTHGTAPDIAGKNIANPGSMILSAAMLLDHIQWHEAASLINRAFSNVIEDGIMTADLVAGRNDVTSLGTREFGDAVIQELSEISQGGTS